jgi:hypothetical protein
MTTERLLRICLIAYPRTRRRTDGQELLGTALELAGGGSSGLREARGLLIGGLMARVSTFTHRVRSAPWRGGLQTLALPLAAVGLAIWTAGSQHIADNESHGWWTLVLAGSAVALVGAATGSRILALPGALVALAPVLAHPDLVGSSVDTHYSSSTGHVSLDVAAAWIPGAILLAVCCAALPTRPKVTPAQAVARLALAAMPAAILLWVAREVPSKAQADAPTGDRLLFAGIAIAVCVALAIALSAAISGRDAKRGLAATIALAVVLPEAIWLMPVYLPLYVRVVPIDPLVQLVFRALAGVVILLALIARFGSTELDPDPVPGPSLST